VPARLGGSTVAELADDETDRVMPEVPLWVCLTMDTGSETVKVLPWPEPGLLARTVPPCNSTSCFTMLRPSPKPPWRRVVDASANRNRSNKCGRNSGAIPSPVSETLISNAN